MSDEIRVRAVEGIACPHAPPRRGFVGYAPVVGDEQADLEVPGGARYRRTAEPEAVPNTIHYRRAVRRGDLEAVEAPAAPVAEEVES